MFKQQSLRKNRGKPSPQVRLEDLLLAVCSDDGTELDFHVDTSLSKGAIVEIAFALLEYTDLINDDQLQVLQSMFGTMHVNRESRPARTKP